MSQYCLPEKGKAALVTISVQRDFLDPQSPLRTSGASKILPSILRVVETFRAAKQPVFHSVRLYRPDGSNAEACRRPWMEEGVRIFMPGSLGSELLDEVKPDPAVRLDPRLLLAGKFQELGQDEEVFYRPRWGAFHDTKLEKKLKSRGVTTLVLCGLSFSTGIRATIYEASARDFRIILVPDALCNATEESVRELGRMGVYLVNSGELSQWIQGGQSVTAAA